MAGIWTSTRRREAMQGVLFASPWLVGFVVFALGPMVGSILLSFTQYDALGPLTSARWVGLRNYAEMFGDELFWKSLWNTVYYAGLSVPLGMGVALSLAMLLNQEVRGIWIFRTIFYMPAVVSGVATAVMWSWLFNPDYGLINMLLRWVGLPGPGWFVTEEWAKPALVIMSVWAVGNMMLIYLAGLQNVPTHLYEAARIDGAGVWAQFRHITMPMLTPTILFNLVMSIIGSFQVFMQAFVLTEGGPNNATLFYVLYLYRKAFQLFEMGYASAMAWVLFLIILGLTALVLKSTPLWVYYEGRRR